MIGPFPKRGLCRSPPICRGLDALTLRPSSAPTLRFQRARSFFIGSESDGSYEPLRVPSKSNS